MSNKIKSFGIKYIGSKRLLLDKIVDVVEQNCENSKSAIDVFAGTTRVAQAFKQRGFDVITSDLAWATEAYSHTWICSNDKTHLLPIINELNSLQGYEGWLTKNYCDVSSADGKNIVRVWQRKNGMKADAIRDRIEELHISHTDKMILITSLILALDAVDNTVGIQQAYLKKWCVRSYNDLLLKLPEHIDGPVGKHFTGDALLIDYPEADIAYLDPPYSGHGYYSYYHIWDSITRWDKPEVALGTNRRIDRTLIDKRKNFDTSMLSPWNNTGTAGDAFRQLIERLPVKYILISYNNESLINQEELEEICTEFGRVTEWEVNFRRNIMSQIGNAVVNNTDGVFKTRNKELLILIEKTKTPQKEIIRKVFGDTAKPLF